jgi:hypothetical protein
MGKSSFSFGRNTYMKAVVSGVFGAMMFSALATTAWAETTLNRHREQR